MGIRRSYYQASQVSAAVDRARADLVAGRVPWLSFKAPASWAAMATGAGDAWAQDLANRLGGLPGPVWVAVHHEPEGDGPAADWKAMQQRLSPIFRAKPNIAYTMILMGWNQFFANKADQSLDVYWPGKQYIDVLGFDPYNWYDTSNSSGAKNYTWTELREYYTKITAWLDATGNSEVKWAVAETGYTDTAAAMPQNGTAPNGKRVSALGSGADWLTRAYDDMKAMGGIALTYFNVSAATNNEPADWTWPLNTTKTTTYTRVLANSDRITDPTTDPSTPTPTPSVPTGLVATAAGPTSVDLAWVAASGATTYTVLRNGAPAGSTTSTAYSDTALTPGATYTYSITATNTTGTSPSSTPVSITIPGTSPTTPTGLVAVATGTRTIALTWTPADGATTYTVLRDGAAVATTATTGFTDTGLAASTTYTYAITATNGAGTSPASDPATATTAPEPATAVAFRASATASGNSTVGSVTVPGNVQAGDTLVLFVSTNTGVATSAMASGWSKVGSRAVNGLGTEMWTRTAPAGEAGRVVSVALPSISKFDLTLLAYSGASTVRPLAALASRSETSSTTKHSTPSLTLPDSSSLVLSYWVDKSSKNTGWSLPTGQIRRAQNVGTGSGRLTSVAADLGASSAAGPWSPVTASANASSARATMWSVALTSAP